MKELLSYNDYMSQKVTEKESGKEAPKEAPKVAPPKEDPVDTSKGTMDKITINDKEYVAVLTTYSAIASKQAAMGSDAVGILSLPGSEKVWEIFSKKKANI
jgi:hypothetical protein